MTTEIDIQAFLAKAEEHVASAASEFVNGRYNACANRCYYPYFQAAIAALIRAGIRSRRPDGSWGHEYAQAQFAGELVVRRKLYPSPFRDILPRTFTLRQMADYRVTSVSRVQAERAVRRTTEFVEAIMGRGGRRS